MTALLYFGALLLAGAVALFLGLTAIAVIATCAARVSWLLIVKLGWV